MAPVYITFGLGSRENCKWQRDRTIFGTKTKRPGNAGYGYFSNAAAFACSAFHAVSWKISSRVANPNTV